MALPTGILLSRRRRRRVPLWAPVLLLVAGLYCAGLLPGLDQGPPPALVLQEIANGTVVLSREQLAAGIRAPHPIR